MSRSTLIYTALGLGAILAAALWFTAPGGGETGPAVTVPDSASAVPKLNMHSHARPVPQIPVASPDGAVTLADYAGQIAVVNFWATWCPPCRKEMPSLNALAAEAPADVTVVTIGTSRTTPEGGAAFLDEIGADHLPRLTDTNGALAREMGILGLPVTVILNREGLEIARLQGDEDWNSPEIRAVLADLSAQ